MLSVQSATARRIKQLRSEAQELVQTGEYRRAVEKFAELEAFEPADPDWPRRAADCHRLLGNRTEQLSALERAADRYARANLVVKGMAICKMMLAVDSGHAAALDWMTKLELLRGVPATGVKRRQLPGERRRTPHREQPAARATPTAKSAATPPSPARQLAAERGLAAVARVALRQTARVRRTPAVEVCDGPPPPISPPQLRQRGPSSGGWQLVDDAELLGSEGPERSAEPFLSLPPLAPEGDLRKFVPGSRSMLVKGAPSGMFRLAIDAKATGRGAKARAQAREVLPAVPLFSELDPQSLAGLITQSRLLHLAPGDVAFRQNDEPECLYVIVNGSVAVIDESASSQELYRLRENEFFGEAALLSNDPRPTTVRAVEECDLMAFDRDAMRACIKYNSNVVPVLLRFLRGRMIEHLINTSSLFTCFNTADRRALSRRFDFIELSEGARLIEQGAASPGLFVLLSGAVDVISREGDQEDWLATLERGELFGEISLLRRTPAVAEVIGVVPGFALMLPPAAFREVIVTHPPILEILTAVSEEREQANRHRASYGRRQR